MTSFGSRYQRAVSLGINNYARRREFLAASTARFYRLIVIASRIMITWACSLISDTLARELGRCDRHLRDTRERATCSAYGRINFPRVKRARGRKLKPLLAQPCRREFLSGDRCDYIHMYIYIYIYIYYSKRGGSVYLVRFRRRCRERTRFACLIALYLSGKNDTLTRGLSGETMRRGITIDARDRIHFPVITRLILL